ncbi:UNVERIFIED_CONTAM: DNA-binding LacI/PurR family transcriptional regulator [Acetivibrio alkalicellulosi]
MKKRKTLGLLINCLDGNYLTYLWLKIKKAVKSLDCNLIVYEGKLLNSQKDDDEKHTIVYGFVDKNRIDGLIVTSSISDCIDDDQYVQFLKRFDGIPIVSIGRIAPDVTNIMVDNKKGMESLVRHLIEDHCYRKIAFVTGPKNNSEAIERYEAYLEVLEEKGISVNNDIIFEGDFSSQSGHRIMKDIIIKEIDYDAIVFSNDDMAFGSIKAIGDLADKYNFDISKKSVICGFDDSINAKLTIPPLTTVRQPFEELCYGAVKTLIDKIDGEKTEDTIKFPAVLVKRQSCGCEGERCIDEISNTYLRLVPQVSIHGGIQSYSLNELFDKITDVLKKCNLRSCFISKYSKGAITYHEQLLLKKSFNVPEKSELIYAFNDCERVEIKDNEKYFNTKDLMPNCYLPNDREFIYLLNPLYFDKDNFGFLCVEVENDEVIEFEALRGQISNTLRGALMIIEKEKMEKILLESERLSSLGQLVGGISHNLMSPIMSISGIYTAWESLIKEHREALEDPDVTIEDRIEISNEMKIWNDRLQELNSYMSKVISTIKSQTTQLNCNITKEFTIEELLDRVNFIKKNNIKLDNCILNIETNINTKTKIEGDITSLVKIIDNLLVNGIESYHKKDDTEHFVDLNIYLEGNSVKIKIRDYGEGICDSIKDEIFKHMITSKGKNGTGLSLLLSYSTVKGKFGGEMWFEEGKDKGTVFYISIPVKKTK